MDAITAMSDSGPAYVFHLLEAFSAAGTAVGRPPDLAMTLVKQTVFGASKLALAPDADRAVLREQVTGPNGTTAATLSVLMNPENGLLFFCGAPLRRLGCAHGNWVSGSRQEDNATRLPDTPVLLNVAEPCCIHEMIYLSERSLDACLIRGRCTDPLFDRTPDRPSLTSPPPARLSN
ncbi:hypothetical protein OE766_22715 [Pararhizobium sp. YC-54]|uniref:pyrroline-5-carboxylate reductase dimerization domain-containing protein n=1 Tax=Pararhizobium sp. YC-54 TaxID=2986920 RepID=UPI0021F737CA|nr:pyrroline-5-carboxylate reductase dimerization domain-containing protein [Pararhizobium sp. YC-54]MCW0001047.1 hypothetical protein [Pararhizobium sp. YC-54]